MRTLALASFLAAVAPLAGCASAPYVLPAGGAPQASATAGGATLSVFASHWEGDPWDLGEYVTPVAVEVYNGGAEPVRISYYDFALSDEHGFRYAALNPYVTASSQREEIDTSRLLANRGRGITIGPPPPGGGRRGGFGVPPPAPHFGGRRAFGPSPRFIGPPRAFVRGGVYLGSSAWRGFVVLPYYRPWFGSGVRFWSDPFFWPPGYATWVWAWSPAFYPSAGPPADVVNLGLPEGVLEPGGHASGYVYFQRGHADAQRLSLSWTPADARTGQPLGEARIALEVSR